MNRNTGFSLNQAPSVGVQRSTFDGLSRSLKTTFNVGDIIPLFCEPVLPGDTFKVSSSKVLRMQTLLSPIMDNIFFDLYWFFVPDRLVWEHFEPFITGAVDDNTPWIPVPEYTVPKLVSNSDGFGEKTLADYFGIPLGVPNRPVNALPFRCYGKIVNDWFISDALTQPYYWSVGDADVQIPDSNLLVSDPPGEVMAIHYGLKPVKACKYPDVFTMCLPSPQRSEDVAVPVAQDSQIPVHTTQFLNSYFDPGSRIGTYRVNSEEASFNVFDDPSVYLDRLGGEYPVYWDFPQQDDYQNPTTVSGKLEVHPFVFYGGDTDITGSSLGEKWVRAYDTDNSDLGMVNYREDRFSSSPIHNPLPQMTLDNYGSWRTPVPVNLVADLNPVFTTINQLRMAFQVQRLYERDARSGSRYTELLRAHFSVESPDARLQRSEYLGGSRFPLHIHQVTQTSSTTEDTALGDTAAMSVTADTHFDFEKSFTEHGYLCCVGCARYTHTYQQALAKDWTRTNRLDFFWPVLSGIGEQPVYRNEIFDQGPEHDHDVFGYQEAWYDYRYRPNMVTGEMRSDSSISLDSWHLADDYETEPYLSDEWLREDEANVDRVIAVDARVADQIFGDFYFDVEATRAMPVHSVPGMIDHF